MQTQAQRRGRIEAAGAAIHPVWVVLATSFGFSLLQLDVTIVNVAMPQIDADLHIGVAGLQWVVDAYALIFASLLLSAGYFSDRFSARRIYLIGLVLFALTSGGCGLAQNGPMLIAMRVAQGIGAAFMLPSSLALLNRATEHEPQLRATAVAWWTASGSISIAAGPVVGGLILALASWRAIFFVNLPLCLLAAYLVLRLNFPSASRHLRAFDFPGQILAIVMLGAAIGGVIELKPLGISDPLVLALFGVALLAGLGFLWAETKVEAPMLPLQLFAERSFSVCMAYGATVNFTYYGMIFVLSFYLQRVMGYSPTQTGLAFLPLTATFFFVNILSGFLVGRYGSRLPMIGGAAFCALGFALLLWLSGSSPYVAMAAPFLIIPLGMGTGVPAMTTAVLASVPKTFSGVAGAALNAGRQAAGAMGVAVFGALMGSGTSEIVTGLHAAAGIAVLLLLIAASLVMVAMPRDHGSAG